MLGFAAAVIVEATTGQNVIQQAQAAPVPIALISLTFIVASIVPIVRGVPRKGNSVFTADAELWNGRLVRLGTCALFHSCCAAYCDLKWYMLFLLPSQPAWCPIICL